MAWRVIAFFTVLTFGGDSFIPHAHGMEKEDEPPQSLYHTAIHHPEQIKNSPQLQDALIHQILYEHYSLPLIQIKPCLSLSRLYEWVNAPLVGTGDETLSINAKYFFLRYGKDLYAYTPTMFFDIHPFYKLMKNLIVTPPTTVPSVTTSTHAQMMSGDQGDIQTTPTPSSETYTPLEEPNPPTVPVLVLDSYLASLNCFLKGVFEEIDGRVWSGNPLNAKNYYEMALNYMDGSTGPYGLPLAAYEIGRIYENGIKSALISHVDLAKDFYYSAVAAEDPRAAFALSRIFEAQGDFETAFHKALIAAKLGHGQAQFKVGHYYHKGIGVEKNAKEARKWYELSRQQGNLEADFQYARFLRAGRGGAKDLKDAFDIYERFANQNYSPKALYYYGLFHLQGVHVPLDKAKAKAPIEKAAELGYEHALNSVGIHFSANLDKKREVYQAAITRYRERKKKPFAKAIFNLAINYIDDENIGSKDKRLVEMEKLLQEIAVSQQDNAKRALCCLGLIAEKQGDPNKAVGHYFNAQENGYDEATFRLAKVYVQLPQVAWKWWYALAETKNKDYFKELQARFAADFFLDRYLFTLKDQAPTGLKDAMEKSYLELSNAAKDLKSNLCDALSVPFDVLEKPGGLVSCVHFNRSDFYGVEFPKESGYCPIVLGSQPYIIFGNPLVIKYRDFTSKLKAIDAKLTEVSKIQSSLENEVAGKYVTLQKAFLSFNQTWQKCVEDTLCQRNRLFFNTFNGVLWLNNGTNKQDALTVFKDNQNQEYWKDEYALTITTQNEGHLKKVLEDSLGALQNAAKGDNQFQPLVSALTIPFHLFKQEGFLFTYGRITSSGTYKKWASYQPFQIGSQYYLIMDEHFIKQYVDFDSNVEKVENRLRDIENNWEHIKKEDQKKYGLVRQYLNEFRHAFDAYVKGTVPQRNQAFEKYLERKRMGYA